MENLLDSVRNAVRALIVKEGKLLVLKKTDGSYSLPGGAPNTGESLEQGLARECLEEIGCHVGIDKLVYVADYFKPRISQPPSTRHQIEFFFLCAVPEDYLPQCGHHPDKRQLDVVWLDLETLEQQPLVPLGIKEPIQRIGGGTVQPLPVYLGTI